MYLYTIVCLLISSPPLHCSFKARFSCFSLSITADLSKATQNNMSEVVEDRISNLPGSILHHILSFVGTRNAARTCVLFKRWMYIWRSIPILKFQNYNSWKADTFIDFVDKTLEFHDESNIKEFSLSSDAYLDEPRIQKWISTVLSHNVEDFSLRLNQSDGVPMPSSFYTCESLTSLRLLSSTVSCFPKYISFPRLERFILTGVKFRDECWNEQLFSNCPVLRFLGVAFCTRSDMKNFCISNPALKDVDIMNPEKGGYGFPNCALKIDAPNLETLTYMGRVAKDYVLSSFPTLVKATVDFSFEEYGAMWEQDIAYGAVACKFLQALAHVMYLKISDRTLQVLSVADDLLNNLPSYHNLHNLILTQEVTADKAVIVLLEKAPNLVSLDFEVFYPPDPDEEEDKDEDVGDDGGKDNH
ncbi:F-box/LRR-repeat protein At3g58900-like [Papaver somniferum]|uniref:F-box/LRR-repeat protein At3g58900-like n=1 Tax=Papaver somniferum TaxID=3469 RepID=UPI000E6F565E|nr:F-box/LRR-repeat protein At3g58900-like [Papaver somniferum]